MDYLETLYGMPLTLLTDLYQLTMAYGYWKTGMKKKNNSGSWSLWVDARGLLNDDPEYFWHADATYPNSCFWQSRD